VNSLGARAAAQSRAIHLPRSLTGKAEATKASGEVNDCQKEQPLAILGHYEYSLIVSCIAFPAKLSHDFGSSYRSHHRAGIGKCFSG